MRAVGLLQGYLHTGTDHKNRIQNKEKEVLAWIAEYWTLLNRSPSVLAFSVFKVSALLSVTPIKFVLPTMFNSTVYVSTHQI